MKIICKTTLLGDPFVGTTFWIEVPDDDPAWGVNRLAHAEGFEAASVDWGDGKVEQVTVESGVVHEYAKGGRYRVRVDDSIRELRCSSGSESAEFSVYTMRIVGFETTATRLGTLLSHCFAWGRKLESLNLRATCDFRLATSCFKECASLSGVLKFAENVALSTTISASPPFIGCTGLTEVQFAKCREEEIRATKAFEADSNLGLPNGRVVFCE